MRLENAETGERRAVVARIFAGSEEEGMGGSKPGNRVLSLTGRRQGGKVGRTTNIPRTEAPPEAEERHLALLERAADGVVMVENGVHIYANIRFLDMFGLESQEEIIGKPLAALVHPDDLERISAYIGRRVSGKTPGGTGRRDARARVYEFRGIKKDGTAIHLEGSDTGIAFRGREVVMCFVRDITDRKKTEEEILKRNSDLQLMLQEGTARLESTHRLLEQEVAERKSAEVALRASEARYRAIVQDQSELVCRFLPDTMLTFVNDAFCRFFGSTREKLIGRSFVPLIFGKPEGRTSDAERAGFLPQASAWSAETLLTRHDGRERWLQWTGQAIRDSEGTPIEFQGVGRDITEAKLAEEERRAAGAALRESEAKFRVLAENTAAGVVIYRNNRLLYTNPAMSTITGFTRDELSRMTVLETIHPEEREEALRWSRAVMRGEAVWTKVESKPVTKSGETRWVDATTGRVVIDNQPAFVCTLIDVTERKVVEDALRQRVRDIEKLYETSRVLLQHIEIGKIYGKICKIGVKEFGFPMLWVGLLEKGSAGVRPVSFCSEGRGRLSTSPLVDREPVTRGPVIRAVASMQPAVTNSIRSDRGFAPWRRATLEKGYRSFAAFPLIYDEEVFGVIAGYSRDEGHFTEDRLHLYQSFTNLAANAVANARLLSSLSGQRDEVRAMASRLADVEESERKQLARELHDRVGQNLTALSINLNILGTQVSGRGPRDTRVDDCLTLLNDMTDSIRNVMGQLRPTLLDEYGLLAALREYCGRFSRRFGVEVEVLGDSSGARLSPASEMAVFRIAQEALNNVAKHARARRAAVTVTRDKNGSVRMVVSDDGEGFVVDEKPAIGSRRGWGLTTMAERAEAIGGFCCVESTPGHGTKVTVEVPK